MKIRTDFVTNSSSSSFITIIIEQKNGEKIQFETNLEDIGHGEDPVPLCYWGDEYLADLLRSVHSGKELMDAIDREYEGMFYGGYANYGAIENIESFDHTKSISITDYWSGDYGSFEKTFVFNCETKTISGTENDFENKNATEYDMLLPELIKEAEKEFGGELPKEIQEDLDSWLRHLEPWPEYFHPIYSLVGYLLFSKKVGEDRTKALLQKLVENDEIIEDLLFNGRGCYYWNKG